MVHNLIADGVTERMRDSTNKKLALWDDVVRNNSFERDPESVKYLLLDPTIYMYAFFRNNDLSAFKLHPYQDVIINDSHKRVMFVAANQVGKSMCLCCKALHFAIMNPGKTVLMTSMTLPQSKDLLRQIKTLLQSSVMDYKANIGDSDTKTEVYFKHRDGPQSRIICVPATEAALGYPADLVLVDELAFYDDSEHFYYQIIQPRTYTTKGQIIVFSNPNGQMGAFWKLWNDDAFHKYRFTFLDCPTNNLSEYEGLKQSLTKEQFDSTVDSVFTSPIGGYFTLQERKAMQEKDKPNVIPVVAPGQLFIFFDWGKTSDHTVRSVGVPVGDGENIGVDVLELKEYPQGTPYNEIVEELEQLIGIYGFGNIAMVGWDNTGVGRGIEDFIKRIEDIGVQAVPVEFSLENKSRLYTVFKLLAERNVRGRFGVKMPFVPACDRQLSTLVFKRSARGYLMIHHESESDRDDFTDSLAGLCGLIAAPDFSPVSVTIVGDVDG